MLVADGFVDLPVSREVALGLGVALGGGLGGVAHLLQSADDLETADETMTVDVSPSVSDEPEPADLFDGHPDPVLYYAATGHGLVVRAANPAFGDRFDVPPDRLAGTPLSEVLPVAAIETLDAETVLAGGVDTVVTAETPSGPVSFRLRTVDSASSGYLVFTPVDA
ncbi:PAS domain-containing protein [Halomicroarcula limicola]|uniref:PAS domain-containing protein n=2 Tax=Haloarcula limicola TaxID=1429915 RepID=A0A8J7YAB8_9EURY|nr:PAS domain-containing protein [Halomicroarcula limicola]